MHVQKLTSITGNPTLQWGLNGYKSDYKFQVSTSNTDNIFVFKLSKTKFNYTKNWITTSEDIVRFNEMINQGYSFGVYEREEIAGWVICEHRRWNNSLYIESLLIAEQHRKTGLGKKLIYAVKNALIANKIRLIELETQNTNMPAVEFYMKQGFHITGLNLKLYGEGLENEFAVFMSFNGFEDCPRH
jgi:ribosomal protein S18 acetylase RimI-like enzyme